eukprot:4563230-Amphidinium_carterae.2
MPLSRTSYNLLSAKRTGGLNPILSVERDNKSGAQSWLRFESDDHSNVHCVPRSCSEPGLKFKLLRWAQWLDRTEVQLVSCKNTIERTQPLSYEFLAPLPRPMT